jgi:hypothetical protein
MARIARKAEARDAAAEGGGQDAQGSDDHAERHEDTRGEDRDGDHSQRTHVMKLPPVRPRHASSCAHVYLVRVCWRLHERA